MNKNRCGIKQCEPNFKFYPSTWPYFVAQIVTCSISFGLWPHVVESNEQNKYHIIYHHTKTKERPLTYWSS